MNKTGLIGLVLVNDKPNLEMRVKKESALIIDTHSTVNESF